MRYLTELNREAKRNARIRNERRILKDEEDIPSSELAHIRRRKAKPTKCRWITMFAELSRHFEAIGQLDPEAAERYLTAVRSEVESLGRKRKGHGWVRTKRIENVLSEY